MWSEQDMAVDASRVGDHYGPVEWQGVVRRSDDWAPCFNSEVYTPGTNNIGEFLAIVDALKLKRSDKESFYALYSDSTVALTWLCKKKSRPNLKKGRREKILPELLRKCDEANQWLQEESDWIDDLVSRGLIRQWMKQFGENPADFGRK